MPNLDNWTSILHNNLVIIIQPCVLRFFNANCEIHSTVQITNCYIVDVLAEAVMASSLP